MHFVLDHNFPVQTTGIEWPASIQVTSLATYDRNLTKNHEDWEIFHALHSRGDVDGFITNDEKLLHLAREMAVFSRTRLALVVTDGVAWDPLRATGLIMVYLRQIAQHKAQVPNEPRLFILRPGSPRPTDIWEIINTIAIGLGMTPHQLVAHELAQIRDL